MSDVLIVDDDPFVLEVLARVVRRAGAAAHFARNAEQARRMMSHRAFDAALVDKNLPNQSGLDLLQEIKKTSPSTEVLIVTAYPNSDTAKEAMRMGASDYVVKPFEVEDFERRLRTALERRRQSSGNDQGERAWAERMAAVSTLAAGVAHEINNPLAFLRSNLEFIARELPKMFEHLPKEGTVSRERALDLTQALAEAVEGADRISSVVESVRLFAQEDRGASGPANLNRVVEAAVRMAWPQVGRRARLEQSLADVPQVIANEPRLGQVILKLLVNAAESIVGGNPQGNTIRVRTEYDAAENQVALWVSDNGTGLSQNDVASAFDPIAASDTRGEGVLGLPLCFALVTSMGGGMTLESQPGSGTTVKLVLPCDSGASMPV